MARGSTFQFSLSALLVFVAIFAVLFTIAGAMWWQPWELIDWVIE